MSKRTSFSEDGVNDKMKQMSNHTAEQLIKLFEKYRISSPVSAEIEAAHRLLAKQRELYLTGRQYADLESLDTLDRTVGEDAALATREKLIKLHCMGKGKYFSPLRLAGNAIIYSLIGCILLIIVGAIILSLLYWYSSNWVEFKLIIPIFPIDPSQNDFVGRILALILAASGGVVYYILTELIPDVRFLSKSYEKNHKRIQKLCNSKQVS